MNDRAIILFDGTCNFCTNWVLRLIRLDRKDRFRFCASQLETAQPIIQQYQLTDLMGETFVLICKGKVMLRSQAIFEIFKLLGGRWKIISVLRILSTTSCDYIYKLVAKNRYQLFGKRENCFVPDEKVKSRFL